MPCHFDQRVDTKSSPKSLAKSDDELAIGRQGQNSSSYLYHVSTSGHLELGSLQMCPSHRISQQKVSTIPVPMDEHIQDMIFPSHVEFVSGHELTRAQFEHFLHLQERPIKECINSFTLKHVKCRRVTKGLQPHYVVATSGMLTIVGSLPPAL